MDACISQGNCTVGVYRVKKKREGQVLDEFWKSVLVMLGLCWPNGKTAVLAVFCQDFFCFDHI